MSEQDEWKSAEQTSGGTAVETGAAPGVDPERAAKLAALLKTVASGGNWFYWIAGLSLINTMIALFNGSMSFVVGLGVMQIVDEIMREFGGLGKLIGLPINLFIAGIYVLFGYFACRRARWAFIVGMVFYTLDALIFLLVQEWFSLAFHAFALFCIYSGLKAEGAARQLEVEIKRSTY